MCQICAKYRATAYIKVAGKRLHVCGSCLKENQ
jgi:ribosome-binding protein aMBF1 (putative translation factor)